MRSEQLNNAPADPAQAGKVTLTKRRSSEYKRYLERKYSSGRWHQSQKSVKGQSPQLLKLLQAQEKAWMERLCILWRQIQVDVLRIHFRAMSLKM